MSNKYKRIKLPLSRDYKALKYLREGKFDEERLKLLKCSLGDFEIFGIGASEAETLLENPYKLFEEKILGVKPEFSQGQLWTFEDSKAVESRIAERFLSLNLYDFEVFSLNKYVNGQDKHIYFKKENPFIKATIDAWAKDKGGTSYIVEFKNSQDLHLMGAFSTYNQTGDYSNYKYFFKYYLQLQVGMYSTGVKKGLLVSQFRNGSETSIKVAEFDYNEELINLLLEKLEEYKKQVLLFFNKREEAKEESFLSAIKEALDKTIDFRIKSGIYSFTGLKVSNMSLKRLENVLVNYENSLKEIKKIQKKAQDEINKNHKELKEVVENEIKEIKDKDKGYFVGIVDNKIIKVFINTKSKLIIDRFKVYLQDLEVA